MSNKGSAFTMPARGALRGMALLGLLICSGAALRAACNYPNWVPGYSGGNYRVGDIVKYTNGQFYQCTNDNPGYDPTISTWFWSPYTCQDTGGTPAGFTWCANENGSYTFGQTVDVAYGANGSFYFKTGVSGTIHFNNATFGDPLYGVGKAGYYKVSSSSGGPAGYTWCASENGSYTFGQTVDVAYGANGAFAYKYGVSGYVAFNNGTFGDPVWGVVKAGYYKNAGGGGVQKPGEVPSDQWSYMVSAAARLSMPADFAWLVAAMDKHESNFGAWLTGGSPSAGDGLMQVQPATRAAYSGSFSAVFGHGYDHGSPSDQIAMGALIVKDMIGLCGGQYRCGLMKYNGGPNYVPGSVDAYGRPIYAEQYSAECMSYYQAYGGTHQ